MNWARGRGSVSRSCILLLVRLLALLKNTGRLSDSEKINSVFNSGSGWGCYSIYDLWFCVLLDLGSALSSANNMGSLLLPFAAGRCR